MQKTGSKMRRRGRRATSHGPPYPCISAGGIIALVLTKEEAMQFKERWRLVNARTAQEIRDTPPEEKLRETAVMFEAAHALGWVDQLAQGEEEARARWIMLKERLGV